MVAAYSLAFYSWRGSFPAVFSIAPAKENIFVGLSCAAYKMPLPPEFLKLKRKRGDDPPDLLCTLCILGMAQPLTNIPKHRHPEGDS